MNRAHQAIEGHAGSIAPRRESRITIGPYNNDQTDLKSPIARQLIRDAGHVAAAHTECAKRWPLRAEIRHTRSGDRRSHREPCDTKTDTPPSRYDWIPARDGIQEALCHNGALAVCTRTTLRPPARAGMRTRAQAARGWVLHSPTCGALKATDEPTQSARHRATRASAPAAFDMPVPGRTLATL